MAPTPTRNNTVPAANRKPMNRTSKRIICLSVQTLDQPKDQPKTSLRSALGTRNRRKPSRIHRPYSILSVPDPRRLPSGILADSGTPCGAFIKRRLWAEQGFWGGAENHSKFDDPRVVSSTIPRSSIGRAGRGQPLGQKP